MDWIDSQNVISWEGRSMRQRRAPPKTYWEEFVETDEWYQQELLGDVPPEELHAACFDSDVDEPDPDMFYRVINTPIPDFRSCLQPYFTSYLRNPFKSMRKKTWYKVGAISVAAVAAVAGAASMSGGWNAN